MRKSILLVCIMLSCVCYAKKKRKPNIPRKALIEKTATEYTVEKDDWLSSIADSYFGNKEDWRKIAEKNPEIKNPDLIYPGNVVSLSSLEQLRDTASVNQDLSSLVQDQARREKENDPPLLRDGNTQVKLRLKHLFLEEGIALGEISGHQDEKNFLLIGEHLFIQSNDRPKLPVGSKFSIVKTVGDLEDNTASDTLKLGELVEVVGELEVIELGEKFITAEMTAVYGRVERKDKIIPLVPSFELGERVSPPSDLVLKVVMGEGFGARLSSVGTMVILNKGTEDKVAPDQFFRVFSDYDPVKDSTKNVEPISKGEVQIVYVSKKASIGYVTKAARAIALGDALVPHQHFSDARALPRKEIETIEIN